MLSAAAAASRAIRSAVCCRVSLRSAASACACAACAAACSSATAEVCDSSWPLICPHAATRAIGGGLLAACKQSQVTASAQSEEERAFTSLAGRRDFWAGRRDFLSPAPRRWCERESRSTNCGLDSLAHLGGFGGGGQGGQGLRPRGHAAHHLKNREREAHLSSNARKDKKRVCQVSLYNYKFL